MLVAGLPGPEVEAPDRLVLAAREERPALARQRHHVVSRARVAKELATAGLILPLQI